MESFRESTDPCVICGAYIPEGYGMVCLNCEARILGGDHEETKKPRERYSTRQGQDK